MRFYTSGNRTDRNFPKAIWLACMMSMIDGCNSKSENNPENSLTSKEVLSDSCSSQPALNFECASSQSAAPITENSAQQTGQLISGTGSEATAGSCPTNSLGASLVFAEGIPIQAIGRSATALMNIMSANGSALVAPNITSDLPNVVSAKQQNLNFLSVGIANLTASACGWTMPFTIEVVGNPGETPLCRELARGISEFATLHPNCIQKSNVKIPICPNELAAFNQALYAAVQCTGDCESLHQVATNARSSYDACRAPVTTNGASCGIEYSEFVERCKVVVSSDCITPGYSSICAGVL